MTTTIDSGEAQGWLTSVLRPAGTLDTAAAWRLTRALTTLAPSSDMIVVDLTATRVPVPGQLAAALRAPARQLTGAGRCLLLVGAAPDLVAALHRAQVQAVLTEMPGAFAVRG
jgi:hypothetical protein